MKGIGIGEAARRSGLKRKQIVYIEERGFLGAVARDRNLRSYTELQVRKLERIAAGRLMGLRLDEAALLADGDGRRSQVELARLCLVTSAKATEIERQVRAWIYLFSEIRAILDPISPSDSAGVQLSSPTH